MLKTRVIPCLLLKGEGLVKTVKFKNPSYIGDPINAVKIFNEREVHELLFLDIDASKEGRSPSVELISNISDECYMPLAYGGGVSTMEHVEQVFKAGAEKVAINTAAIENPELITNAAQVFGSQSIVGALDAKKNLWGKYEVRYLKGQKNAKRNPVDHAKHLEDLGAGEIFINSIDNDGMMNGYDLKLVKEVAGAVKVPVIASGGAGKLEHFKEVIKDGGASAVAAGSMFVYHGPLKGVLINYPESSDLEAVLD